MLTIPSLVLALDLAGTFVFALSGAMAGVRRRLDVFGVLVLSFAASTSGGIVRDLLIGATPPAAIEDWRYLGMAAAAGLLTFFRYGLLERLHHPVRMFDAAGLALFAVAGAQKALGFGLSAPMAALLGMLTGIGGGMARDMLLAEVPMVLRAEIYAVAALAGALVVVLGALAGLPSALTTISGAILCFVLRMLAVERDWRLPVARKPGAKKGVEGRRYGERPPEED